MELPKEPKRFHKGDSNQLINKHNNITIKAKIVNIATNWNKRKHSKPYYVECL